MAVEKVDYKEVADFINGVMEGDAPKEGIVTFNIKQSDYMTFMKDRGITEDTIRQVAKANTDFDNGMVVVAKDKLLEDDSLSRVIIKTRTPNGVNEFRYTREVNARTPKTGETKVKYGVVSIAVRRKSRLDKALMDDCSAAIEAACK